jgi:hypothetical protein
MQPDPSELTKRIDLTIPLVGLYDAPDPTAFAPLIVPTEGTCMFEFLEQIFAGGTLHITKEHYGCRGAGNSLCGFDSFPQESLVKFLVETEGLKVSTDLMMQWVNRRERFRPKHGNVMIGHLRPEQYEYLKSVTFVVNPDQLSAVMTGAQYYAGPDDPAPVIAPFSSGCGLLVPFADFDAPQASLGATDMAMREHVKPDQMLFTVTKPMFERLCSLDEKSFLYRKFWNGLREARGLPKL